MRNILIFLEGAWAAMLVFAVISALFLFPAISAYEYLRYEVFNEDKTAFVSGFRVRQNSQGFITRIYYGESRNVFGYYKGNRFHIFSGNDKFYSYIQSANKEQSLRKGVRSSQLIFKYDCSSWQVRPIQQLEYRDYFAQGEGIEIGLPQIMERWFTPGDRSPLDDGLISACSVG